MALINPNTSYLWYTIWNPWNISLGLSLSLSWNLILDISLRCKSYLRAHLYGSHIIQLTENNYPKFSTQRCYVVEALTFAKTEANVYAQANSKPDYLNLRLGMHNVCAQQSLRDRFKSEIMHFFGNDARQSLLRDSRQIEGLFMSLIFKWQFKMLGKGLIICLSSNLCLSLCQP